MSAVVSLEPPEMVNAAIIGVLRRVSALARQRPEPHGSPEDAWSTDIHAAAAEMAVAKYLDVYWRALAPNGNLGKLAGDVASYQVRHTLRPAGRLILHREDPSDRVFVLVCGTPPDLTLAGWILARDGQLEQYWEEFTGRPCYFVPQADLHSVADLAYVVERT